MNQQKPKTQMKMKTTKNYEVNYCKMCRRFWWVRMFSHINTLPTLLMNCKGCKYSQLHMSVKHDHEHERKEHMMSRRQQHQQPHKEGLALWHRVTWSLWHTGGSRQGHPRYTSASSTRRLPTDDHKTETSLGSNVLSATGVVRHLESYKRSREQKWYRIPASIVSA